MERGGWQVKLQYFGHLMRRADSLEKTLMLGGIGYPGRGVSLHGCSSKAQPLLLTLDEGYLLTTALPDLQCALSFRVATGTSWSPLSGLKGVQPPLPFGERTRDCSPGHHWSQAHSHIEVT